MVMFPPTANPRVTAGFKCPPEMLAAMETPTNNANAWATAIATRPAGSRAAPEVNLSAKKGKITLILYIMTKIVSFPCDQIVTRSSRENNIL